MPATINAVYLGMIINGADVLKFSDIAQNGYVDLTNFVENQDTDENGSAFIEFLIPFEVLSIADINKEALVKYKGQIRLADPVIIRDPIGLFEKEERPPYYYLTLFAV
jgi:hypothetical protein